MPNRINESFHAAEFILSDQGEYSYENEVIDASVAYKSGTPVAKLTAGGKLVAWDNDGNDGSQTLYGLLVYPSDSVGPGAVRKVSVLRRNAEVFDNNGRLAYPAGADAAATAALKAACIAALAGLGIILRD